MTDAEFVHEIAQPLIRDACDLVLILTLTHAILSFRPQ